MATNTPPSFRFPFASLGKLQPEAQAAHLATFNALTDIYQSISQQKENSSSSTTTINERSSEHQERLVQQGLRPSTERKVR
jgi:uncharacterized protein YfkK (UPF0435 family)